MTLLGTGGPGKNLNAPRGGPGKDLPTVPLPVERPKKVVGKAGKKGMKKLVWPICKVKDTMECKFQRDNTWRIVEVVAIRKDEQQGLMYYVRYKEFDKRLDEWVTKHRLRKPSEHARVQADKKGRRSGRRQEEMSAQQAEYEQQHDELNKMRNIERVIIGKYSLKTWYFSPYPEKYNRPGGTMFVCEYCLKYMQRGSSLRNHLAECTYRHPPGDEIYRHNGVSIFEVDGGMNKVYCQNLCLFCKLFLDHKTLYFGVNPFLFYIVCEFDEEGYHIVGFFSKEKASPENFNLACILTFPYHQRKGWGKFLISLSYEITRREHKTGSPEKPLSDLGKRAYMSYWCHEVLKVLSEKNCNVNMKDISKITGIAREDVVETCQTLKLNTYHKKSHVVNADKLPLVQRLLYECEERARQKPSANNFDPKKLFWQPKIKERPRRKQKRSRRY